MAAAGYALALAASPADPIIAMRAYRQAVAVGDYALASRAAAVLVRAGTAPPDTALLAYTFALKARDLPGAQRALDRLASGPFDFLAPAMGAWLAQERGESGVAALDAAKDNALASRYNARQRGLLLIAAGRRAEAAVAMAGSMTRLSLDPLPKKANAALGISRLFLSVADDVEDQKLDILSILLARSALLLDSSEDRARLYLAKALSRQGDHDSALSVLQEVSRKSPQAHAATAARVTVLRQAGRQDEAVALARSLAHERGASLIDARVYADVLDEQGDHAGAAQAYAELIRRGGEQDWELHFRRGRALDQADRWNEALPALQRAAELAPDQAQPLEYLGDAQVRRNQDLARAQALLERARKLKPNDAGIKGSLAWAYYRQGDVATALPLLESAAKDDPGGTRINEHLGDAYWQLGRHYEARYAWRAAAIDADAESAARLVDKLANGLTRQVN